MVNFTSEWRPEPDRRNPFLEQGELSMEFFMQTLMHRTMDQVDRLLVQGREYLVPTAIRSPENIDDFISLIWGDLIADVSKNQNFNTYFYSIIHRIFHKFFEIEIGSEADILIQRIGDIIDDMYEDRIENSRHSKSDKEAWIEVLLELRHSETCDRIAEIIDQILSVSTRPETPPE